MTFLRLLCLEICHQANHEMDKINNSIFLNSLKCVWVIWGCRGDDLNNKVVTKLYSSLEVYALNIFMRMSWWNPGSGKSRVIDDMDA